MPRKILVQNNEKRFDSFRRRKGNLDERQNKSQIALATAISNFELKPLHIPRKKRFNDRPIHISNFEPINSGWERRGSLMKNASGASESALKKYRNPIILDQ